jgi:protein KRI1
VQRDEDSDHEPSKKKQVKKEAKLVSDKELLARFYGNDQELNAGEKFLRNYILNEGWKDSGAM